MKLAVIGAGSTYTPELIEGLIKKKDEFPIEEINLMDIDENRLDKVASFCRRMSKNRGGNFVINTFNKLKKPALQDVSYIVTQIRVGGQQGRNFDINLGKKYDLIGQETTGVGGFSKSLRTVPEIIKICNKIEKYAPGAWLINFTNPSGIITEAINRYTDVKAIGLCNVPINMKIEAAEILKAEVDNIYLDYVGLNHLGWVRHVYKGEEDVLEKILKNKAEKPANISTKKIPKYFLKALNMIPSPYLRYYYNQDKILKEQKKSNKTRAEEVMEIEEKLLELYSDPAQKEKPELLSERGGAYYSYVAAEIMSAIYNDKHKNFIVNVPNNGAVKQFLPEDVMEIPVIISASGPRSLLVGEVEPEIYGLMSRVKSYERLTVEAAVERDYQKALLAVENNPLIDSVEKSKQVLGDIINHYNLNDYRNGD